MNSVACLVAARWRISGRCTRSMRSASAGARCGVLQKAIQFASPGPY